MTCPISSKRLLIFVFFAALALALGVGLNKWHSAKYRINPASGMDLILPEFHLIDGQGKPFTKHRLIGHYSFLFFGYSHCQGICPLTLAMLTKLYAQLNAEKLPLPQIIFITLDPKRDTQKVVGDYVKAFNPAFIGVTGPLAGIQQLSKQMGVVYIQTQQAANENYQIDHSGTIYLINPEGKLAAVFSPPHEEESIKKDYTTLIHPH